MFSADKTPVEIVCREDPAQPLASHAPHPFELDGAEWPSAEHYCQAMLFDDPQLRETIRLAPHPADAGKLARRHRRALRGDWKKRRQVLMTRALYTICQRYPYVAEALRATGERRIVENSQYDYYWGCGRDGRGENVYGQVLMALRQKLNEAG